MPIRFYINVYAQGGIYIIAGLNHFIQPEIYYPLIPPYLGDPSLINLAAGIAEVLLGIGLLVKPTRKLAAYGLIAMLIAFVPSHLYFIQIGSCVESILCVAPWIAWARLIVIHPLLMYWAYVASTLRPNHS